MVPVVGEVADGVNGIIYAARGDKVNAALSFGAMIPVVGNAATAGKWVNKGAKAAKGISESAQKANKGLLGNVKEKVNKQVSNVKTQIQARVDEVKQQLRQLRAPQTELAGVNVVRMSDTGTVGKNTSSSSPKPSNSQPPQNGSNKKPDENKGTGNNSKGVEGTNKFKFVENAKNHLINVENVNTKKGIVGGHNMDEFNKALKSQGFNPNDLIVSKKPHQLIEGIYEVEYKIPRKDMAGNIAEPVSYKNIKDPKTVYDPSKISDDKIYQWGQEAMQNGKVDGRIVEGTASNGLKFRGYLNEAGEITNFFPIID